MSYLFSANLQKHWRHIQNLINTPIKSVDVQTCHYWFNNQKIYYIIAQSLPICYPYLLNTN